MGAGASTTDKLELQRAYAAWEEATAPGQPALTDEGFLKLLKTAAPTLHQKATATGSGAAAAASLRSQFETAKQKLQMRALGKSSGRISRQPSESAPAPPPLQKLYSWAPDKQTNLTRGLRAGMLGSEPLRLIDLSIGGVSVAALLDTGAEHCAMSPSAAKRCGLQPLVDESFGGVAGGIGTAAKQGRVHYAKVTLGKGVAAAPPDACAPAAAAAPASAGKDAAAEREAIAAMPIKKIAEELKQLGAWKDDHGMYEKSEFVDALLAARRKNPDAGPAPIQFEVAFDVMDWPPHVNFAAIVGIDFLARHKAVIDVCGDSLQLVAASGEKVAAALRKDGR